MKTVKMLKALPGYAKGQVVEFDENSAAALIRRGDAAAYDGDTPARSLDLAGQPVDNPASAGEVPTRESLKADLVAYAETQGVEGADAMTKSELADTLGLE